MKKLLLFITAFVITLTACKKDESPTSLIINFTQTIDGTNLTLGAGFHDGTECLPSHSCCLGTLPYTNNEGQEYNVKRLLYIISDITLHVEDGTDNLVADIHFIDVSEPATLKLVVSDLKDNNYTSISYTIGLDATKNINNIYLNEDFHTKMFWPEPMGGGYHYMKLEGNFENDSSFYNTHTGGAMGEDYSFNHTDIISLITDETTSEVNVSINMEVNNWYQSPNSITLSNNGIMADVEIQNDLKENGIDVFNTSIH